MRITNKNEKVTISIVGAGNRAKAYVDALEQFYPNQFEIIAIFDPNIERKDFYEKKYGVKKDMLFSGYEEFIKRPRLSDIVIIATLDDMHFIPTKHAIAQGYDIILEKPIAMSIEETVALGSIPKKDDQLIAVCHVLRHSPFFKKIKEIVDSKELGEVINIQHNENIGYYHFAHSYVRGSWRNTDISAPLIVAKSCHDMDILLYLLDNKHAKKVSSYGALSLFRNERFDHQKMAKRCFDCPSEEKCVYSAIKIYGSNKMKSVVFDTSSAEKLKAELADSQYGRCVFACDNNVCDHQVAIIEFEEGVTATFNLSAFTNTIHRSIKIMCEYGEIRGTETTKEIEVTHFGSTPVVHKVEILAGGHSGADSGFIMNFMESYLTGKPFDSTLDKSIESHVMAYASEVSRSNGGITIDLEAYHNKVLQSVKGGTKNV